jgi:hypothetical protein
MFKRRSVHDIQLAPEELERKIQLPRFDLSTTPSPRCSQVVYEYNRAGAKMRSLITGFAGAVGSLATLEVIEITVGGLKVPIVDPNAPVLFSALAWVGVVGAGIAMGRIRSAKERGLEEVAEPLIRNFTTNPQSDVDRVMLDDLAQRNIVTRFERTDERD